MTEYGHFSKDGREFIITNLNTPHTWNNYLSNDKYCALISQTGGGFSFFENSGFDRITRYYPLESLTLDQPGRYIYMRDNVSGDTWSANWQPMKRPMENAFARHGLGYTVVSAKYKGIATEITYFVPVEDNIEIWWVKVKNDSKEVRKLSAFSYVDFVLGNYLYDLVERSFANLFNEVYCDENGVIFGRKRFWNVPPFRGDVEEKKYFSGNPNLAWDKWAFMGSTFKPKGWDCVRQKFSGYNRGVDNPLVVETGKCTNSNSMGEEAVGVLQHDFSLKPGEEVSFAIILGICFHREEGKHLIKKYSSNKTIQHEFDKLWEQWDKYIDAIKVDTPDPGFNLSVNIWNKCQCWVTARWSRMASPYIGGGSVLGFRDTCQDTMGIMSMNREFARDRVMELLRHQFADGGTVHNWDPRTNQASRTGHSDDPLWLIMCVSQYIKETGDFGILHEMVEFYDHGINTVYKHLIKAANHALGMTSPIGEGLGISLMGAADWNDGLDRVGCRGKGESVMTAEFLAWMLLELADLCEAYDDPYLANHFKHEYGHIKEQVNSKCWDGAWYIRATNDDGEVIGSKKCTEAKIWLNPQTWAIMSGIAESERGIQAMNSVKKHLETDYGPMIFTPAFRDINPKIGIITRFAPGTKENGTIFNHPVTWAVIAECILGRGERAYEIFKKSSFTLNHVNHQERYKSEPYVYSEFVFGPDSSNYGEGSYTWTTGTASWMHRACLEYILGVRPTLNGLLIDPCIPKGWKKFKVKRIFRGAVFNIEVSNPDGVNKGIRSMTVNDKPVKGNLIGIQNGTKVFNVKVVMGKATKAVKPPARKRSDKKAKR
jgi:cellobiose phosphorylase